MDLIFVSLAAFLSSAFTAVLGVGGGMLLIALMSVVMAPALVIPLHGVAQLASNVSRGWFGWREICWPLVWRFVVGGVMGALLGSQLLIRFPVIYLPIPIGVFILLMTWVPYIKQRLWLPGGFISLGCVQAILTLFVGASGPLNMPFLLRKNLRRDALVVTASALMTVVHLTKLVTFMSLGFDFSANGRLIVVLVVSVSVGSYLGTLWRHRLPEALFRLLLKWMLTVLAVRMIIVAL